MLCIGDRASVLRSVSWVNSEDHGCSWRHTQITSHHNPKYETHQPKPKYRLHFKCKITKAIHEFAYFLLFQYDPGFFTGEMSQHLYDKTQWGMPNIDLLSRSQGLTKFTLQNNDTDFRGINLTAPHIAQHIYYLNLYTAHWVVKPA